MFDEHNNMSGNAPPWLTYSNWGPHIYAPKHGRISTPFSEEGTSPIKGMDFYPLPPAFRRGLISGYMFIEQYVLHFSSNINFEKDYIMLHPVKILNHLRLILVPNIPTQFIWWGANLTHLFFQLLIRFIKQNSGLK